MNILVNNIKRLIFVTVSFFIFSSVHSQNNGDSILVSGIVTGSDNLPVAGAMVYIKGFSSSFSDDIGNFIIMVPSEAATLQCQAKGFQYTETALKGRNKINIKLQKEGYKTLQGKVIYPFSEIPRSNSVLAGDNTGVENAKTMNVESPELFLQGKVAGLNVTSASGTPGAGSELLIRGYNSLYLGNRPLVIVDGMILDYADFGSPLILNSYQNLLSTIDGKDLQSITVLKDAVSIYGSRASNGVILVTTKHTDDATTKITFNTYGGINYSPELYPVMEATDYKPYLAEILLSNGYSPENINSSAVFNDDASSPGYYNFNNNTNWQKEIFKNNLTQNYYMGVTGGDDVAKYNLSLGYTESGGIIKNTDFSRFNTRFNSDIYFSNHLLVNLNLGFAVVTRNLFDNGIDQRTSPLYLSLINGPYLYPYNKSENGTVSSEYSSSEIFSNPVALINESNYLNKDNNFLGSVNLKYVLNDNMDVRSLVGVNYNKTIDDIFIPKTGIVPDTTYLTIERASNMRVNRFNSLYNENRLNYHKIFGNAHSLDANIGFRLLSKNIEENWTKDYNSANDYSRSQGFGVRELAENGGFIGNNNWMSLFLQADYNYFKKYFVSAVIETDASSTYGDEAEGLGLFSGKFGLFPSIGAAWLLSSEEFMAGVSLIDLLKLRVNYGMTGNDGLGNYWNRRIYVNNQLFGQNVIVPGNILNPSVKWETNKKMNVGIDIALFGDRVNMNMDYYNCVTEDMIMPISLPSYTGFEYYFTNSGSMKNTGIEMGIFARLVNKELKFDLGFNVSKNTNEIIEIPDGEYVTGIGGATIVSTEGFPMGRFKGYKILGVFATEEEAVQAGLYKTEANGDVTYFGAGDVIFDDKDGNHEINENDMDFIGDPNPDFIGGITSVLSWKGIKLDALFTYSLGNDIYNYQRAKLESMSGYENQTLAVRNRWKAEGQITDMPKVTFGDPMGNTRFSDRWIEDGSFLKLKSLTLSYNRVFKKGFERNITIFMTGNNLLVFTKYKGYDPEFSIDSNPFSRGIDFGLVPNYKSIIFGISLGL